MQKALALIAIVLFVTGLLAVLVAFFGAKIQAFAPHYMARQGAESKIYLASQTASYTLPSETNTSIYGQKVPSGMGIFTITLTVRNDYAKDNPPPSCNGQVFPVDGTAYIILRGTLSKNDVSAGIVNLTPSDFSTTLPDQTGIVLASGQTSTIQLYLATDEPEKVTYYLVMLDYVGDSIPR